MRETYGRQAVRRPEFPAIAGSPQLRATTEARLLELVDELGDDAFRVHYNDYVESPERLKPLFDWLGAPWDEQAVRETMAVKHSY